MCSLRILIAICLLLGIRGIGVAWTVLTKLDLYRAVHAAGPWWLRVILNAIWGIIFIMLAWGLWRRRWWAYRAFLPALFTYAIFAFFWLALFVQAVYDRQRLASVAVTSAIGLCFALWLTTRVHRFFGDSGNGAGESRTNGQRER